ncbi:MAG: hypothetical protein AMXMBFR46_05320 [Acidimicrobiia bacterium]
MRARRGGVAAVLGATVAIAAGTAAGGPWASAASSPEACRLLTAREITAALGQPAAKGAPGSAPRVCDWRLAATDVRPIGSVHALVTRGGDAKRSFALARQFHLDDREPLDGLGRRAFFAPTLGTVWVLEDRSTVFYVQVVYPRPARSDPGRAGSPPTPAESPVPTAPAAPTATGETTLRDAVVGLAERAEGRVGSGS